jgi:large subunit ribosomal protein L4
MSAIVLTAEEARKAKIDLITEAEKGRQAVHDLVVAYRANRRTGSACTKTRGEVSGNNRKIYKQKGTGGARHGDKRAPIFVGGGVVFGPRPRDYSRQLTKTVRKLALRRTLGDLVRAEKIKTVASLSVADGKTKSFLAAINTITTPGKILVVSNSFDESTYLAGRNVAHVQLVTGSDVNVEQLLLANSVILVGDALQTLAQRSA